MMNNNLWGKICLRLASVTARTHDVEKVELHDDEKLLKKNEQKCKH